MSWYRAVAALAFGLLIVALGVLFALPVLPQQNAFDKTRRQAVEPSRPHPAVGEAVLRASREVDPSPIDTDPWRDPDGVLHPIPCRVEPAVTSEAWVGLPTPDRRIEIRGGRFEIPLPSEVPEQGAGFMFLHVPGYSDTMLVYSRAGCVADPVPLSHGVIEGVVVDSSGHPVAGVVVACDMMVVRSREDGGFFLPVAADGCDVYAERDRERISPTHFVGPGEGAELELVLFDSAGAQESE